MNGMIRLVGGTHAEIVKRGDWETVEKEFTPMDFINILSFFDLTPERREWVRKLMKKKVGGNGDVFEVWRSRMQVPEGGMMFVLELVIKSTTHDLRRIKLNNLDTRTTTSKITLVAHINKLRTLLGVFEDEILGSMEQHT